MSRRKHEHRVKVRKYRRHSGFGKPLWWAECQCGDFQGYHHKPDALDWKRMHEAEL